jgi:DUF4097 and DUF4098 domain-containing protein YvlB
MAVLQEANLCVPPRVCMQQVSIRCSTMQQAALLTLMMALCLSSAAFAQSKKEYHFTVGPHANIVVDTQYGAISVKPGNDNEVVVTATVRSNAVEVDRQQNGNRVAIATHLLQGTNSLTGQVDYELLVPADATLNLRSSLGMLTAERLHGDLTLEGSDAVVNVHDTENGHVHVRTIRGPVTLTNIRNGHVEISTIGGDVHLKSVTGPVVQATTSSGKIFYDGDFAASGDYRFSTHKGDIEALVPVNVSADFSAHSMLGRVQHDFPLQPRHDRFPPEEGRSFVGTTGKASSEVVLRSFSGRIRLKQR